MSPLPPLCACGLDPLENHPDNCARNCIFYKNATAYQCAAPPSLLYRRPSSLCGTYPPWACVRHPGSMWRRAARRPTPWLSPPAYHPRYGECVAVATPSQARALGPIRPADPPRRRLGHVV